LTNEGLILLDGLLKK